jgi:hypothetical protein
MAKAAAKAAGLPDPAPPPAAPTSAPSRARTAVASVPSLPPVREYREDDSSRRSLERANSAWAERNEQNRLIREANLEKQARMRVEREAPP